MKVNIRNMLIKKQSKKVHYTYIFKKDSVFQNNLILTEMCDVEIIYLIRFIFPLTRCLEKVIKCDTWVWFSFCGILKQIHAQKHWGRVVTSHPSAVFAKTVQGMQTKNDSLVHKSAFLSRPILKLKKTLITMYCE